jgi:hypothetical protein
MFMNTPHYQYKLCWDINPTAYSHLHGMFNNSGACFGEECTPMAAVKAAGCSSALSWKTASTLGMSAFAGLVSLVLIF